MSKGKGVIIEFVPMGGYVKVSAFHEATMTEVSIVGDPQQGESVLKQTVLKKLEYVLNKKDQEKNTRKPGGRGIVV